MIRQSVIINQDKKSLIIDYFHTTRDSVSTERLRTALSYAILTTGNISL